MRSRILGSALVVVAVLIPTFIGGPMFALLLIFLGIIGFHEYLHLDSSIAHTVLDPSAFVGYVVIIALGAAGLASTSARPLLAITVAAVLSSLALQLLAKTQEKSAAHRWSFTSVGSLYLGLPIYAAASLRMLPGNIEIPWLSSLATLVSIGWEPAPRGLAWALSVILIVWMSDTTAYVVGRSFGKRKLAPNISPGKTVEGAIGGLIGAMLVGCAVAVIFGLAAWPIGLAIGAALGCLGQIGDLCESALKRQANAKDSGTLIPGHGGILDRIDAMLFAFPAAFLIATQLEGFGA